MMRLFSKIDVNVHNVDLRISDPDKKRKGEWKSGDEERKSGVER